METRKQTVSVVFNRTAAEFDMLVLSPVQEQSDDSSEDEAAGDSDSTRTRNTWHTIYNRPVFSFSLLIYRLHSLIPLVHCYIDFFCSWFFKIISVPILNSAV